MSAVPKLKLRVSPAAEKAVRRGHPWVFADRIRERNRDGSAGELAVIYDRNDRFLAIGLYDPDSPIAVRVLQAGAPIQLDDAWWHDRIRAPLENRFALFEGRGTTGYRCINGESDGWPGLVLDRYEECAVLKVYSACWLPHRDRLRVLIDHHLHPRHLVLRLSRNIRQAAEGLHLSDGQMLQGGAVSNPVVFRENGLSFEADVLRGQKTGFFLDQRDNRQRVRELSRGRDVLNVFSHAGGFSVYAAAGGATSTVDLDISGHALDAARRNMILNRNKPNVSSCAHNTVKADAFEWLARQPASGFDLVVIDPPSLARRESEKPGAITAYKNLADAGIRLLRPGGILVSASCSAHVAAEEFFDTVRQVARRSTEPVRELQTTQHAPDHPATIPEAHYLKCIFLKRS